MSKVSDAHLMIVVAKLVLHDATECGDDASLSRGIMLRPACLMSDAGDAGGYIHIKFSIKR